MLSTYPGTSTPLEPLMALAFDYFCIFIQYQMTRKTDSFADVALA
jgi:hypothetical protein